MYVCIKTAVLLWQKKKLSRRREEKVGMYDIDKSNGIRFKTATTNNINKKTHYITNNHKLSIKQTTKQKNIIFKKLTVLFKAHGTHITFQLF